MFTLLSYNFRIIFLFVLLCLSACQTIDSRHSAVDTMAILHDDVFPYADAYAIETPQSLFWLSDEAKDFVDLAVSGRMSDEKQVQGLMSHIFNRAEFDLLYQADANTDANTTFEKRAANCLSLTIMTYAMAEHAGFNARFQKIDIPEFWTRRDGYALLNGHINLRIVPNYTVSTLSLYRRDLVIDFDPQEGGYDFNADELSKERIVAMFYNNKAAELVIKGELNHAYAYLRAALRVDPHYEGALLNLGLIYRHAGELVYAETAYLAAISLDEDYLTAWENLATLYNRTQRENEAQAIYARLERHRINNAYYHLMLAEQALDEGQPTQSIQHFKDAIALDDNPHQFYSGLAQAFLNLGDLDNSQRYLKIAQRKAGKARIAVNYSEKMSMVAKLRSQESQE